MSYPVSSVVMKYKHETNMFKKNSAGVFLLYKIFLLKASIGNSATSPWPFEIITFSHAIFLSDRRHPGSSQVVLLHRGLKKMWSLLSQLNRLTHVVWAT